MSDAPPPPPPPPQGDGRGRGPGIAAGVVTTLALGVVAVLLAGNVGDAAAGLIPVALLIAAGFIWRKVPGFVLGIVWTFGVAAILFTACTAIVLISLG